MATAKDNKPEVMKTEDQVANKAAVSTNDEAVVKYGTESDGSNTDLPGSEVIDAPPDHEAVKAAIGDSGQSLVQESDFQRFSHRDKILSKAQRLEYAKMELKKEEARVQVDKETLEVQEKLAKLREENPSSEVKNASPVPSEIHNQPAAVGDVVSNGHALSPADKKKTANSQVEPAKTTEVK